MERSDSKLMQMQARYQQKQMQEREMKIASLYEAQQARALERVRHSPAESLASPPSAPHVPGKVRQMFEERRTKGIDKSYPLQPIHNTDRTRKPLPNGFTKVTSTKVVENGTKSSTRVVENGTKMSTRVMESGTKVSSNRIAENGRMTNTRIAENGKISTHVTVEKKTNKKSHVINSHSVKKHEIKSEREVNGSGDLNHNHQPDLNAAKQTMRHSDGEVVPSLDALDAEHNYLLENETFPEALAPATTPRSPERPPRRSPATKVSPATRASPAKAKPAAPPRRARSDNAVAEPRAPGVMQRGANPAPVNLAKKLPSGSLTKSRTAGSASSTGGASAGATCAVCGRHFAPDRLAKHQDICRKAHAKKRKPFDALKHRLAGTDAEPFLSKLRKAPPSSKVKPLNSSWRQKHEEFVQAIRAAKQVQQHLAAGGKLSDLPPPPPSENPDYVACPTCGRRFNQAAAERHIPKCASFQFNKPRPAASRRR